MGETGDAAAFYEDTDPAPLRFEGVGMSVQQLPYRHAEKPDVGNSAAHADVSSISPEEPRYPLPRAWMTTSMSDVGYWESPPIEQHQDSVAKPPLSLIALAKTAIYLRRWMQKKHARMKNRAMAAPNTLIGVEDIALVDVGEAPNYSEQHLLRYVIDEVFFIPTIVQTHSHPSSCQVYVNRFGSPTLLDSEELSSSSHAVSVDSLDESTEESQDDHGSLCLPCCEENATVENIVCGLQPLLNRVPDQLGIDFRRLLCLNIGVWLRNRRNLQRPVQHDPPPETSTSNSTATEFPQTSRAENGQKRASNDDDEKFPGEGDDGDRKRPRIRLKPRPEIGPHRWACPYYQREPHRYCIGKWHLCAKSPGFSQVHRVKSVLPCILLNVGLTGTLNEPLEVIYTIVMLQFTVNGVT